MLECQNKLKNQLPSQRVSWIGGGVASQNSFNKDREFSGSNIKSHQFKPPELTFFKHLLAHLQQQPGFQKGTKSTNWNFFRPVGNSKKRAGHAESEPKECRLCQLRHPGAPPMNQRERSPRTSGQLADAAQRTKVQIDLGEGICSSITMR